jgi:hypothetical protein
MLEKLRSLNTQVLIIPNITYLKASPELKSVNLIIANRLTTVRKNCFIDARLLVLKTKSLTNVEENAFDRAVFLKQIDLRKVT